MHRVFVVWDTDFFLMEARFDVAFGNIAQAAGGIDALLDEFFGFLQRKTDFYASVEPAVAEKLVLKVFREKQALASEDRKRRAEKLNRQKQAAQEKFQLDQEKMRERPRFEEVTEEAEEQEEPKADDSPPRSPPPEKEDAAPPGNGGVTDRYSWTQTLQSVEVSVPVPKGTVKRSVQVTLTRNKLKVCVAGQDPVVDGAFHGSVRPDDSYWVFDSAIPAIQISIEKMDQMKWWSSVIQGDPSIDTQKIVPEESKLSDLDSETRAMVEKMMIDQRRKAAGLPSTEDDEKAKMLDKFKAAHPQMDFSKATVNWGS
eukprot:Polyplicarium_translucidae@DN2755_c0_g1_i1.p1